MKKLLTLAIATALSQNFILAQTATLSEPLQSFSILSGTSISSVQTTNVAGAVGAIGTVDTTVISRDTTLRGSLCVTQRAMDSLTAVRSRLKQMPAQTYTTTTLSNTTLTSGTYRYNSSLTLSGTVTLTGDSTSLYVFNVDRSLTFDANTQLILSGGVKAENIYFNVDSSVKILDSAVVCGNILADGTICCSKDISASGTRLMSSDSVCLINTKDTLGIISDSRLAVFGSTCGCPVDLGQGDTCANKITMNGSEMWFRFVADSTYMKIGVQTNNNRPIDSLNLYEGTCSGLQLFAYKSAGNGGDTILEIDNSGFVNGNSYFLKINGTAKNNLNVCVFKNPTTFTTCSCYNLSVDENVFPLSNPTTPLSNLSPCTQYSFEYTIFGSCNAFPAPSITDMITIQLPNGIFTTNPPIFTFSGAGSVTPDASSTPSTPVFNVSNWNLSFNLTLNITVTTPPCGPASPSPAIVDGAIACNPPVTVDNNLTILDTKLSVTNLSTLSGALLLNTGDVTELVFKIQNVSSNTADINAVELTYSANPVTNILGYYIDITAPAIIPVDNTYTYPYYGLLTVIPPNSGTLIIDQTEFSKPTVFNSNVFPDGQTFYLHIAVAVPWDVNTTGYCGSPTAPDGEYDFVVKCGATNCGAVIPQPTSISVITVSPSLQAIPLTLTSTPPLPTYLNATYFTCGNNTSDIGFYYSNATTHSPLLPMGCAKATDIKLYIYSDVSFGNLDASTFKINNISIPTLTVTDPYGCTATVTQWVTIATNCCAFQSNIIYNVLPPTIISSVTWMSNYKINQTITVKAPAILTIASGVRIEFGPIGKIIVENGDPALGISGAQLVLGTVGTGPLLTSITYSFPACPIMWPGIEVWGNTWKTNSVTQGQGKITIKTGTIIEDAHIAVLLGKKSTCVPGPLVKCPFYDVGNSGGIIDANSATFRRNGISIRFFPYAIQNTSKIEACTFDGSVQVRDGGYSTSSSYPYPNPTNPYYAPSNSLKVSSWHVHLWGTKDIKFYDNIFKDVYYEAILATDSRFSVKKLNSPNGNVFGKIVNPGIPYGYGIHIINTVSAPSYFHEISDNTFIPCPGIGIGIDGNKGSDLIQRNTFDAQSNVSQGIQLINSSGFNINDNNNFNIMSMGIGVQNSGSGGGNIGFPYGNTFTNCSSNSAIGACACSFGGGNPYLQIKCNNFNNSLSAYYQGNPSNTFSQSNNIKTDNLGNQGSYPANQSEDKKPAANEFLQVSNPPNPSTDRNQFYSYMPFVYYRHHRDAQGGFKVMPTANSLVTITENTNVNKLSTSCDPYPNPCPPPMPPCWPQRIQNLSDQIGPLQIEFSSVFATLDKGQKAALVSAINGNMSDGQLKNLLLQNSPLSDAVLLAFINRNGTSPGNFKNVMIPNMPVSDTILPVLFNKLKTLPAGITTQIKYAQGYNPGYRTLTAILRDISRIEMERAQVLSGAVAYYVENDSIGKLTAILEQQGTDYANQLLFTTYLSDSNLSSATAKLSALPASTPEDQAYRSLNTMLITLASGGNTVFEITSMQEQLVRQIATMPTSCLARTNARAILLLVFNERYPEDMFFSNLRMSMNDNSTAETITTESSIYPNPANEKIEFHFELSDGGNGILEIFSLIGAKLASYPVYSNQKQVTIPVVGLANGVYIYRFLVEGELQEEGKFVIVR